MSSSSNNNCSSPLSTLYSDLNVSALRQELQRSASVQQYATDIEVLHSREKAILFSTPEMEELANQMIKDQSSGDDIFLKKGIIDWKEFPDTMPNILIRNIEDVRSRSVVFLCSLEPAKMFREISVMYALPRYLVSNFIVVLPFLSTGTMERIEYEGYVATAKTMIRLLSATPLCSNGPMKCLIYDIHALQERFYFGDSVIPVLISAIPIFLDWLKHQTDQNNIAIAFPDAGAVKRFASLFKGFELICCMKTRSGDQRHVTLKYGDPKDKHVFLVDDLVQTGGTLLSSKNLLYKEGAKHVSAFVTHGVFPQESWKKFTPQNDPKPFKHFLLTNSVPNTAKILQNIEPFEVLSLSKNLLVNLQRYFFNR